jgi:hypothetical protein
VVPYIPDLSFISWFPVSFDFVYFWCTFPTNEDGLIFHTSLQGGVQGS